MSVMGYSHRTSYRFLEAIGLVGGARHSKPASCAVNQQQILQKYLFRKGDLYYDGSKN